jgi:hypothetical protein
MSAGVASPGLPERQNVRWRPRVDEALLRRNDRWWTLTTLAHSVPFLLAAGLLMVVKPILAPVALLLAAHAWVIPALYARRGADVLARRTHGAPGPEARALLLLGDLGGGGGRSSARTHRRAPGQLLLRPGDRQGPASRRPCRAPAARAPLR